MAIYNERLDWSNCNPSNELFFQTIQLSPRVEMEAFFLFKKIPSHHLNIFIEVLPTKYNLFMKRKPLWVCRHCLRRSSCITFISFHVFLHNFNFPLQAKSAHGSFVEVIWFRRSNWFQAQKYFSIEVLELLYPIKICFCFKATTIFTSSRSPIFSFSNYHKKPKWKPKILIYFMHNFI